MMRVVALVDIPHACFLDLNITASDIDDAFGPEETICADELKHD